MPAAVLSAPPLRGAADENLSHGYFCTGASSFEEPGVQRDPSRSAELADRALRVDSAPRRLAAPPLVATASESASPPEGASGMHGPLPAGAAAGRRRPSITLSELHPSQARASSPPLPPVLTGHVSSLPPVLTGHVLYHALRAPPVSGKSLRPLLAPPPCSPTLLRSRPRRQPFTNRRGDYSAQGAEPPPRARLLELRREWLTTLENAELPTAERLAVAVNMHSALCAGDFEACPPPPPPPPPY